MKKQKPVLTLLFIFGFVSTILFENTPTFAQTEDSGNKIFIADLNCSAFPTITMLVRGVDANGTPLSPEIVGAGVSVFENDQPIAEIAPLGAEEAPKYVVFAFDRGFQANLTEFQVEIESVLQDYENNYFTPDFDTVQFLPVTVDSATGSTPITTVESFDLEMDSLALSKTGNLTDKNDRFGHMETFFKSLTGLNPGRYSMAVIYLTRIVEEATEDAKIQAESLGTFLKSKNIAIHVINTDKSGNANQGIREPFELLAAANGGQYLPLIDSKTFPKDAVGRLFQSIELNAQSFRVQFTAQTLDAEYGVGPLDTGLLGITDKQTCLDAPPLSTPEVQITSAVGTNPVVSLTAGQTAISVQAAMQNWDGSRRIAKVELLVDGTVEDTDEIAADAPRTAFTLNWDISQRNLTQSTSAILMVRVTDQFGTVGTSPEVALQIIPAPPPTATPEPTVTTSVVPPASQACKETPFTPSCMMEWVQRNIVLILLVVLVVVLIILFNTNRKLAAFASSGGQAIAQRVSKGMEQVRKTLLGGTSIRKEAIAYLNVLVARPDRAGGRIEIYNNRTTLGRDPKLTDIQLYNLDDQSSVSGLHSTIFFDQGKFFITDDNSSNGTFLNGKRLAANDPAELPNNAEIILGDLYRQGAKLTFEIATGSGAQSIDAYPEEEPDFHVDLSDDGSVSYSPPPHKAGATTEDDFRKTIPGYREDMDLSAAGAPAPSPMKPTDTGNKTDIFHEPPPSPPPIMPPAAQPAKPKPAQPKKKGDDGWMKDLG